MNVCAASDRYTRKVSARVLPFLEQSGDLETRGSLLLGICDLTSFGHHYIVLRVRCCLN